MRTRFFYLLLASFTLIPPEAIAGDIIKEYLDNRDLTQNVFEYPDGTPREHSTYVIQQDLVLKEDIFIPAHCVLQFDGGSIRGNHTITGNNTIIEAGLVNVFDLNTSFKGKWIVKEVYPEWFGADGMDSIDDTAPFQKAIDFSILVDAPLYLCNANYYISSTLYIENSINMKASSRYSFGRSNIILTNNRDDITMFMPGVSGRIVHSVFEGITFTRNRTAEERATAPEGKGLGRKGCCFGTINEVTFKDCGFIGFKTILGEGCSLCYINNCSGCYFNNFIEVTKPISSLYIFNSNLFSFNKVISNESGFGIQQLVFDNCWMEEFYKFYYGAIRHLQGISVTNSTLTNTSYINGRDKEDYFIDFTKKDPSNRFVTFNFINSTIYSKYQLIDPLIAGYKVGSSWIYHYYGFDFYDCRIYCDCDIPDNVRVSGNSWWYNTSNYWMKPSQTNYGIDTRESILYNDALFKGRAVFEKEIRLPASTNTDANTMSIGPTKMVYIYDDEKRRMCIPSVYLDMGEGEPTNVSQNKYFVFKWNADTSGQPILKYVDKQQQYEEVLLYVGKKSGTTNQRESALNYPLGSVWYDTDLKKPVWQTGSKWVEADGAKAGVSRSGPFEKKPSSNDIYAGFQYFNTDTHRTITWSEGKWWNPDGTEAKY